MRKFVLSAFAFTIIAFGTLSFRTADPEPLKWYTWEEAVALNKVTPKKMMVDVYTDWCGWCKKMDKGAFVDPEVAAYISANFYPVKFNAEQRTEIKFNEETFGFVANDKACLLQGRLHNPFLYLPQAFICNHLIRNRNPAGAWRKGYIGIVVAPKFAHPLLVSCPAYQPRRRVLYAINGILYFPHLRKKRRIGVFSIWNWGSSQ